MEETADSPASVADGVTHPLDPRWIAYQRHAAWISSGVVALLLIAAGAGAVLLGDMPGIPVAAVVLGIGAGNTWFSQWWPAIEYRYASYRIDGPTLEIRRGVLWRSCLDVPRSRIQHSDVSQGPLERRYQLGTLSLYTAGTEHALVQLHGLAHSRALEIRAYLMQADEADVI